jgi:hypothetical protein
MEEFDMKRNLEKYREIDAGTPMKVGSEITQYRPSGSPSGDHRWVELEGKN